MTVTQLRQLLGVAYSSQDRIHNRQAGGSGQVADDVVNLQIHLVQRLLHVLEMKGGQLNEIIAMTPSRTDCADFVVRAKRASQ
jgi:hypothetical protein